MTEQTRPLSAGQTAQPRALTSAGSQSQQLSKGLHQMGVAFKLIEDKDFQQEMITQKLKKDIIKENAKSKMDKPDYISHIQIDPDLQDIFEVQDPGHGDEFMAVLPWKGAIKEPKNHNPPRQDKPDVNYKIDFVYGFKCEDARMNLYYNDQGLPVYMTAAIGVILDPKTRTQTYFGGGETQEMTRKQHDSSQGGHTDDITALAISNDRQLVATGQVGQCPSICVWDSSTAELRHSFKIAKGSRGVSAIGFSKDGRYLALSDLHNDHNMHVFDLQSGGKEPVFSKKGGPDKFFHLCWSLAADTFCAVGPKVIQFWTLTGTSKRGILGSHPQTNMACVAFDDAGNAFTGAQNGNIYKFGGNSASAVGQVHKSVVHSIRFAEGKLLSGGSDNRLCMVDPKTLQMLNEIQLQGTVRSIDMMGAKILVGLRTGQIQEIDTTANPLKPSALMHSHHEGETWGLAIIPGEMQFITSGDDNKVMKWDMNTKRCVVINKISAVPADGQPKKPARKIVGGASTLSSLPADCQSRALAYLKTQQHLAIAQNDGIVSVRLVADNQNKVIAILKDSKEWVECMEYSPCGKYLAVGSHDNNIYVYQVSEKYPRHCVLKAHTSFITALDWSADSTYIRSNCGSYELLFFNVQAKKQDPSGASSTTGTEWATGTVKLGWHVQGIYPAGCDGTHINSVDVSDSGNYIATGDDYGLLNVYWNPCLEDANNGRSYRGHSEHVTRVNFIEDDEFIITCGGYDQTVIQWRRT